MRTTLFARRYKHKNIRIKNIYRKGGEKKKRKIDNPRIPMSSAPRDRLEIRIEI